MLCDLKLDTAFNWLLQVNIRKNIVNSKSAISDHCISSDI